MRASGCTAPYFTAINVIVKSQGQLGDVVFVTSPIARRASVHLRTFCGVLQADVLGRIDQLYQPGRLSEAAFGAHVRRKFFNIHPQMPHRSPPRPSSASALCMRWSLRFVDSWAATRGALPASQAGVGLRDELQVWLTATRANRRRSPKLLDAIRYALSRLSALIAEPTYDLDRSANADRTQSRCC